MSSIRVPSFGLWTGEEDVLELPIYAKDASQSLAVELGDSRQHLYSVRSTSPAPIIPRFDSDVSLSGAQFSSVASQDSSSAVSTRSDTETTSNTLSELSEVEAEPGREVRAFGLIQQFEKIVRPRTTSARFESSSDLHPQANDLRSAPRRSETAPTMSSSSHTDNTHDLARTRLELYQRAQAYLESLKEALLPISLMVDRLRAQLSSLASQEPSRQEGIEDTHHDESPSANLAIRPRSFDFIDGTTAQVPSSEVATCATTERPGGQNSTNTGQGRSSGVLQLNLVGPNNTSALSGHPTRPEGTRESGLLLQSAANDPSLQSLGPGKFLCLDHPDVVELESGYCTESRKEPSVSLIERRMMKHRFYAHARCRTVLRSRQEYEEHTANCTTTQAKACKSPACRQCQPPGQHLRDPPNTCPYGCITTQEQLYVILARLRHGENVRLRMFADIHVPNKPPYYPPEAYIPRSHHGSQQLHSFLGQEGLPNPMVPIPLFEPGFVPPQLHHDIAVQGLLRQIELMHEHIAALQTEVMNITHQPYLLNLDNFRRDLRSRDQVYIAFQVMFHDRAHPRMYTTEQLRDMVREAIGDPTFEVGWMDNPLSQPTSSVLMSE